jgi:hypothetical protein
MSNLIDFVCRVVGISTVAGPTITIVNGAWGLCERPHQSAHDWIRIAPTNPGFTHDAAALGGSHRTDSAKRDEPADDVDKRLDAPQAT